MGDYMRESRISDIDKEKDKDTKMDRREETLWTEDRISRALIASAEEQPVPDSLLPENIKERLLAERKAENAKKGNRRAVWLRHFTEAAAVIALAVIIGGITMRSQQNSGQTKDYAAENPEYAELIGDEAANEGAQYDLEKEHSARAGDLYHLASDYDEIYDVIAFADGYLYSTTGNWDFDAAVEEAADSSGSGGQVKLNDFSTTNVQQSGVDESDIIKTDGKYIYVVQDRCVKIVEINGGEMELVNEIRPDLSAADQIIELYIDDDKLYIILSRTATGLISNEENTYSGDSGLSGSYDFYSVSTDNYIELQTYEISDSGTERLLGSVTQDGYYYTSRKVGDYVYLFSYKNLYGYTEDTIEDVIPYVQGVQVDADCIYIPEQAQSELIAVSVDGNAPGQVVDRIVVMNNNASVYMGTDAIYLYNTKYDYSADAKQITEIAKFSYKDGYMDAVAAASAVGQVTDTFAISEKDNYLRILTTDWYWNNSDWSNQLYIFDEELNLCGEITEIAVGESIYAARYLDDMAYFITYRNTDPLYVADLSDPANPVLLGNVEISGFSDYLHSYGDGMLLGIGYETDENSFQEGVKLTMFDAGNGEEPVILDYTVLSDMDYTPSGNFYKTVLVDPKKNLIGFLAYDWDNEWACYYMIYRWEDGKFKRVISEKLADEGMWGVSDIGVRGLYVGDYFYLVTLDSIKAYRIDDGFSAIGDLNLK